MKIKIFQNIAKNQYIVITHRRKNNSENLINPIIMMRVRITWLIEKIIMQKNNLTRIIPYIYSKNQVIHHNLTQIS